MQNQFVTFEIAVQLKELGFDDPCIGYYYEPVKDLVQFSFSFHEVGLDYKICDAPLWQQLFEWLLLKKILIEISPIDSWNSWTYYIKLEDLMSPFFLAINGLSDNLEYKSYMDAREQAYLQALEIIKINKQ